MNPNITFLIMLVGMMALMFFMQRSQKKQAQKRMESLNKLQKGCLLYTSPSPRDRSVSRMPSSA